MKQYTIEEFRKWLLFYFPDMLERDRGKIIENAGLLKKSTNIVYRDVERLVTQYIVAPNLEKYPDLWKLLGDYCNEYGVSPDIIRSKRTGFGRGRNKAANERRRFILYVSNRSLHGPSAVAEFLGYKSHSSVQRIMAGTEEEHRTKMRVRAKVKKVTSELKKKYNREYKKRKNAIGNISS